MKSPKTKILIVDDHEVMRNQIAGFLADQEDLEVCADASNYFQALELLDDFKPQIALVDIALKPGPSGLDLVKTIQKHNLPCQCIIMSARSTDELTAYCQENSIPHCISKLEFISKLIPLINSLK